MFVDWEADGNYRLDKKIGSGSLCGLIVVQFTWSYKASSISPHHIILIIISNILGQPAPRYPKPDKKEEVGDGVRG